MSLRYYDVLETTLQDLQKWAHSDNITKADVLESVRQRIVQLMRHVITTPLIGTCFAYPGDINLEEVLATLDPHGQPS